MPSVFERHPKASLSVFLLIFIIALTGLAEIALRFIVSYDIGYYVAVRGQGVYHYPYGDITINSDGFPDQEFDRASPKQRIGYFGDSVIFGVGAGEEYRFSTLLEQLYPKYEHWTFSMLGNGIQDLRMVNTVEKYGLDTVIYGFNLNDIVPAIDEEDVVHESNPNIEIKPEKAPLLYKIQRWVFNHPDQILRGKSYLYTYLRTGAKNILNRLGIGHTGFAAAELFPDQNRAVIEDVAARINEVASVLQKRGVNFCLVIFPYEMQISKDAQKVYKDLGIHWEEGFATGSTQKILKDELEIANVYDGMEAFKGLKDTAKTGEYFVYNKGDKIDFNHPNRAGHALLAKGFAASRSCPPLR